MKPYNLRTGGSVRCGHCGLWFRSLKLWQWHRYGAFGERACLTPYELHWFGWRKDTKGRWKLPDEHEYDYNRKNSPAKPLDKPLQS